MKVTLMATILFLVLKSEAFITNKGWKRSWSPFDDHQFMPDRPQWFLSKSDQDHPTLFIDKLKESAKPERGPNHKPHLKDFCFRCVL